MILVCDVSSSLPVFRLSNDFKELPSFWPFAAAASAAASVELSEALEDPRSPLSLRPLPLRLNKDLLKICALSGRSREGMLLVVERCDDLLDRVKLSMPCSQEGLSDDDPDEFVYWLSCLSATEFLRTWLATALRRPGEGGPSSAGSSMSLKFWNGALVGGALIEEAVCGGETSDGWKEADPLRGIHPFDFLGTVYTGSGEYML